MKKLLLLLLCCLLLTACSQPAPEPAYPTSLPTGAPTETALPETQPPTEIATEPETEPPTQAPTESPTVTIYYGNENCDGFESTEVQVEEVSMNILVEKLVEAGVLTDDIGIWSMQIDGTCLHLTFSPTFGDLIRAQGTAGEYIIIGSVVNTFLDAFDAETVYITVGNDILESGHMVYDFPIEFME